jgi:hypothetical protein
MRKLMLGLVLVAALTLSATASAGGWAGSRYEKSDCTYDKAADTLFCEAFFSEEQQGVTEFRYLSDASCASGIRVIERTGTLVTTIRVWGVFTGRVPHAKNEDFGDEEPFGESSWTNFTDVDLGCFVADRA